MLSNLPTWAIVCIMLCAIPFILAGFGVAVRVFIGLSVFATWLAVGCVRLILWPFLGLKKWWRRYHAPRTVGVPDLRTW